jgi:hypothetical protein
MLIHFKGVPPRFSDVFAKSAHPGVSPAGCILLRATMSQEFPGENGGVIGKKNMKEHHPQIEVFTGEIWEHHPQIEVFLGKDEKNMEQHHIHRVIEVLILRSNSLPRNFLRMYHRTK